MVTLGLRGFNVIVNIMLHINNSTRTVSDNEINICTSRHMADTKRSVSKPDSIYMLDEKRLVATLPKITRMRYQSHFLSLQTL